MDRGQVLTRGQVLDRINIELYKIFKSQGLVLALSALMLEDILERVQNTAGLLKIIERHAQDLDLA